MPEPDSATDNAYQFRRLVLSVQANLRKLDVLIAICDNPTYRDRLIQTYETELQAQGITCHRVKLSRDRPSLKQALLDLTGDSATDSAADPTEQPQIVTVCGADQLLSIRLNQEKSARERLFFSLQWTRESLRQFRFPIIFWLTEPLAQAIAQQAPDFWSWRGGVFEFLQPLPWQQPTTYALGASIEQWHVTGGSAQKNVFIGNHAPIVKDNQGTVNIQITENQIQGDQVGGDKVAGDKVMGNKITQTIHLPEPAPERDTSNDSEPLADPADLQATIASLESQDPDSPLLASLYHDLGTTYARRLDRGIATDYPQEQAYAIAALQAAIARREPQGEDAALATSLNELALLYKSMGRYGEAEPLYARSLAIREQQLGADHPDTAASLNNLAVLYDSMGRYSEAEPLYARSLAIWEQQLGADHEAEPLYARSLAIWEQQLGADHPDTASSLNNLALLYDSMGRYGEAEPLYARSLAIREQQLGADHPGTATALNNLAEFYRSMGRYSEAEPLYARSLAIKEQQLGADHPSTATSLNNLAGLYTSMGRYGEAEPLYLRALEIKQKMLPEDHPSLKLGWDNLRYLIQQAVQNDRVGELSDHPRTQAMLAQLR